MSPETIISLAAIFGSPFRRIGNGGAEDVSYKVCHLRQPREGNPSHAGRSSIANDLTMKLLISKEDQEKAGVSYSSPAYLHERHGLPEESLQDLAAVATLASKAGE